MNYNELADAISSYVEEVQSLINSGEEEFDYENALQCLVNGQYDREKLPIKLVYQTPSYDGAEKEWVFEHKNENESVFVMFEGYYSSYEDSHVEEDFKEVKPYTFTETRYK